MKYCPGCHSSFPDSDQFCELDGTTLVLEHPDSEVAGHRTQQEPRVVLPPGARNARIRFWQTLPLVTVAVVAIGLVLFLVYHALTREAPESSSASSANMAAPPPQVSNLRPAAPIASASPATEPSPSPSSTPTPAALVEPARVALSSSPISTGGDEKTRRGQITIRLMNGNTVEADEVWETKEGVWYRRRGVVTLVERKLVKAIEISHEKISPPASPTGSP
jgi:hypothetical protein